MLLYALDRDCDAAPAREALFAKLEPKLVETLATAELVSRADVASRMKATFPIEASGIGGPSGRQPEGYWWKLTSKCARVRSFMETGSMAGDDRPSMLVVYSWFHEPESPTPLVTRVFHIGFRVAWSFGRRVVAHLASKRYGSMALVSDDGAYGFAVSEYLGYLPKEYDDGELIYRVARWRPHT